jgi:hypothetical protein
MTALADVDRSAVLSEDGVYRYSLTRSFPPLDPAVDRGRVCWQLCNPSTADALKDDPTVLKGVGFALRWGYSSIEFVNRAAFRATNPKHLLSAADPIGPENARYVREAFDRADLIVFAWGKAWPKKLDRLSPVPSVAPRYAMCLGHNDDGSPRHPLMLAYATPLVAAAVSGTEGPE